MKVSNIKCKLKHSISTMEICGSYMSEFSVNKDMKKNSNDKRREISEQEDGAPTLKLQVQ